MLNLHAFISILSFLNFEICFAVRLPSWIKPCNAADDNFQECLFQQAQKALPIVGKGIPEFGLEPFDPISIGEQKIMYEGMHFTLSDGMLHGLSKAKLKNLNVNLATKKVELELFGDLKLIAKCKLDGAPKMFSFNGKEACTAHLKDTEIKVNCKLRSVTGKDNKTHLETYDLESEQTFGKVYFTLGTNNAAVAGIEGAINDRWRELVRKFAPPITNVIANKINALFNKFHSEIPLDELIVSGDKNRF